MTVIQVRVQPRSSRREILERKEGVWRIALTSPPAEGKANHELLKFIAKCLSIAPSHLELTSGEKSRDKRIDIHGLSESQVQERLSAHLRRR